MEDGGRCALLSLLCTSIQLRNRLGARLSGCVTGWLVMHRGGVCHATNGPPYQWSPQTIYVALSRPPRHLVLP